MDRCCKCPFRWSQISLLFIFYPGRSEGAPTLSESESRRVECEGRSRRPQAGGSSSPHDAADGSSATVSGSASHSTDRPWRRGRWRHQGRTSRCREWPRRVTVKHGTEYIFDHSRQDRCGFLSSSHRRSNLSPTQPLAPTHLLQSHQLCRKCLLGDKAR